MLKKKALYYQTLLWASVITKHIAVWPVTSHVYKRATKPGLPAGTICTQPNLACQTSQSMYKVTYIVHKVHMVYTPPFKGKL